MIDSLRLGQLITGPAERDAIHIAVAPVEIAGTRRLNPGTRLDFLPGSATLVVPCLNGGIGILDPFLDGPAPVGSVAWMYLRPGSITSLRHEWQHPAFAQVERAQVRDEDKAVSEKWLREYAVRLNPYEVAANGELAAFAALIKGLQSGEILAHGSDLHGLYELEDADDLKAHAERYLGISINWGNFTFSCSC